ncbi:MAG: hypothetical protein AAF798_11430 [Bacteroidota bacterium]
MQKSHSYHQLLCDFVENDCLREHLDYQLKEVSKDQTEIIGAVIRKNGNQNWNVYLVLAPSESSPLRILKPVYKDLERCMANILCQYTAKVHNVERKSETDFEIFAQAN